MATTQAAVFNEMLRVEVDSTAFSASLAKMKQAYQDALKEMSAQGIDLGKFSNDLSLGDFSKQIGELSLQLEALSSVFSEVANKSNVASSSIATSLRNTTQVAGEEAEKVTSIYKRSIQEQLDAYKQIAAMGAGERSQLSPELQKFFTANAPDDAAKIKARLRTLGAPDTVSEERAYADIQKRVQEQLNSTQSERLKGFQALEDISGNFVDKNELAYERDVANAKKATDQKVANAESGFNKISQEAEAAQAKVQAKVQAEAEKMGETQIAAENRAIDDQLNRLPARLATEGESASASGNLGLFGQFKRGFTGAGSETSWAEFLGNVTRFSLAWGGVGLILNSVRDTVRGIFDTFKSGITYLSEIQDSSTLIQGALMGATTAAGSLTEHFQQTAQVADYVAVKIKEMAAATGIPERDLRESYSSSIRAGLGYMMPNTDDQLKFIQDISLAVKSTGANSTDMRIALENLPKLIDGSIQPTNDLLSILGVTKQQWQDILDKATQYHDLTELLPANLQAAAQEGQQMASNEKQAFAEVKLTIQELMSDIDKPVFGAWVSGLQTVNKWLLQNKGVVEDTIKELPHESGAAAILGIAGGLAAGPGGAFAGAILGHEATPYLDKLRSLLAPHVHPSAYKPNSLGEFEASLLGEGGISPSTFVKMLGAPSFRTVPIPASLGGLPYKKPPQTASDAQDQFSSYQDEYSSAIQSTQSKFAQIRQQAQEAMSARKESVEQGTAAIVKSYNDEIAKLDEITKKYKGLVAAVQSLDDKVVKKFETTASNKLSSTTTTLENKRTAASDKGVEYEQRIADAHRRAMAQIELTNIGPQSSVVRQLQSSGYLSQSQSLRAQLGLLQRKYGVQYGLAENELANAGVDTQLQQRAKDAIASVLEQMQAAVSQYMPRIFEATTKEGIQNQLGELNISTAGLQQQSGSVSRRVALHGSQFGYGAQAALEEAKIALKIAENQEKQAQIILDEAKKKGQKPAINAATLKLMSAQLGVVRAQTGVDTASNIPGATGHFFRDTLMTNLFGLSPSGDTYQSVLPSPGKLSAFVPLHGAKDSNGDTIKPFDALAQDAQSLGKVFKDLGDTVLGVMSAYKKGGVGAAIGAGMQDIGAMIPGPAGMAIQGVGEVISTISSIFEAAAQNIAEHAQLAFSKIQEQYSTGQSDLSTAIQQEQALIDSTVSSLSGMKGGQQELKDILPQMQSALDSLKAEADKITVGFNASLDALNLNNTTLEDFAKKWQQVNQEVVQYVGAGGSIQQASKYMSDSLEALQYSYSLQNNQNESTAVNDALQLNNLIEERINLETEEQKKQFALENADAIERRVAPGIAAAQALAEQNVQYNEQMNNLNYQITLQQQKVDAETKFFGIQGNINQLQQLGAQLQQTALADQIKQWTAIQEIVNGITNNGGVYSMTQALAALLGGASNIWTPGGLGQFGGINPTNINITINAPGSDAQTIATTVTQALRGGMPTGPTTKKPPSF